MFIKILFFLFCGIHQLEGAELYTVFVLNRQYVGSQKQY